MLIDWVTVAAQIVNFLILVILLKVFLYDRIIKAMDKREQRIAGQLGEAADKRREAEQEKREYQEQKKRLAGEREEVMAEAGREAEARRKEMIDKAKADVEEMAGNWRRSVERDREDLIAELTRVTTAQAVRIAGRAVSDLADGELARCVAQAFIEKLKELGGDDLKTLAQSAREQGKVEVLAAADLPGEIRDKVTRAVHEIVADGVEVEYIPGALGLGFVLRTGSRKFDWSLDGYLRGYHAKVAAALAGELLKLREQEDLDKGGKTAPEAGTGA